MCVQSMYVWMFWIFCFCFRDLLFDQAIPCFSILALRFVLKRMSEMEEEIRKKQQLCSVKVKPHKLLKNIAGIAVKRFHTSKKINIRIVSTY